MSGEGNTAKKIVKGALKLLSRKILIVVIIAVLILGMIPMLYVVMRDDFDELNEKADKYSAKVGGYGEVTYVKQDENGNEIPVTAEEIAGDLAEVLKEYIGGDEEYCKEKIKYLMNAESVTKMPYIENSGEDGALVGQVKFYRFDSENDASSAYETDSEGNTKIKESYRLTYIDSSTFETQKQNYEASGNEEIFKHFTMDDEGNIKIAYGKKEVRTITTGDATHASDSEITLDKVKEVSSKQTYTGDYKNGFSMVEYIAYEKTIDYLSLVEQYVMPANLLYSFLIQSRNINFVEAIADLAYKNEIALGIYDNESESIKTETYVYGKMLEMNATTKLDFYKISTSEPVTPEMKFNNLNTDQYSKVPHRCVLILQLRMR